MDSATKKIRKWMYFKTFKPYSGIIPYIDNSYDSLVGLVYFLLNPIIKKTKHSYLPRIFALQSIGRMDGIEAFCRSFIGAGYLISAEKKRGKLNKTLDNLIGYYAQGILQGTDPASAQFWGDNRHLLVENTSIIIGLFNTEDIIWNVYSSNEKECVLGYIRKFLKKDFYENNWLWFIIFHFLFLERMGGEDHSNEIERLLNKIEQWHLGDGWYSDGNPADGIHVDYYSAWAMQYYALAFVLHASDKYKNKKRIFLERGIEFIKTYQYFFIAGATHPPYGRSQLYRFAAIGPIGLLLAIQDKLDIDLDRLKVSLSDNLKAFFQKEILDSDGFLTMGFYGPCPDVLERYSGSGSPYWAMKAFSLLLIPENSAFWDPCEIHQNEEVVITIKSIKQVIVHNRSSEIKLFNAGVISKDYPSKYNKFVYSNLFLGDYSKRELFPDNTLLIRRQVKWYSIGKIISSYCESGVCRIQWSPEIIDDVLIKTLIAGFTDGYFFVHKFSCPFALTFKLGGFLLEDDANVEFNINECSTILRNNLSRRSSLLYVAMPFDGTMSVEATKNTINGQRYSCPIYSGSIPFNTTEPTIAGWVGTSIGLAQPDVPRIEVADSQYILRKGEKQYRYEIR